MAVTRARVIHLEAPSATAANGKVWFFGEDGSRLEVKTSAAAGVGADVATLALIPSAVFTTTGNGATTDAGGATNGVFKLDVTAASGTSPTLDVKIQVLAFDGTTWLDQATFAQKTGVASEFKSVSLSGRKVRAIYTIGGTTPSFTFSVIGEVRV